MQEKVRQRRAAPQIVHEPRSRFELKHVADVRIPEVGVDQEGRVVDLHRKADGEVECDRRLACALVGARYARRRQVVWRICIRICVRSSLNRSAVMSSLTDVTRWRSSTRAGIGTVRVVVYWTRPIGWPGKRGVAGCWI